MENKKTNMNSVVAKSNELIGQMAKFELSELRLIAYCLAHYDSRKGENRAFKARVEDFRDIFPSMDKKSAYAVIRRTMLNLGKKPLEIKEGTKRYYWNWFSGFVYDEGEGQFEFRITPEIQPYLLQLEGNFTRYRLKDVYQFRAASTWKLYEILKRWLVKREWEVQLDELRLLLGVAGKYPRWSDFEIRVIKPALAEINNLSDIKASYEKIKSGRSIVRLTFLIDGKNFENDEHVIDVKTPEQELSWELKRAGIHKVTAEKYSILLGHAEKIDLILKKLPGIINRAAGKKGREQKYILGAIQAELDQRDLFTSPKEEEKRREKTVAWLKTLSNEPLEHLAEAGNMLAKAELKTRKK